MGKKDGGLCCAICDAKGDLRNTRGRMVCPTCQKIISYVDNHPERIADAAKGLGKEAVLAALLGVAATADPEDHAIAEAVRECFGRELSVEQLGLRCKEEAEKAARIEGELVQIRAWLEEAMRKLVAVLPHEDEGLDDTRSYADIVDLAELAAERIKAPVLAGAAENNAKAACAWNALMERARSMGFADIADGDPEIMAATYIMAVDEVMRERDRLKTELDRVRFQLNNAQATIADLEKASSEADDRPLGEKILDGALLNWARVQMEDGKLSLNVVETPVAA